MKNNRQAMILDIITKENVETQEQLLEHLRQRLCQNPRHTCEQQPLSHFIPHSSFPQFLSAKRPHASAVTSVRKPQILPEEPSITYK